MSQLTLVPVFYHSLVDWVSLDELIARLHPEEQTKARQLINHAHDYLVHETILHHLDRTHHHEYLALCLEKHHDEGLLAWLEEKVEGIMDVLREVITTLKTSLEELFGVSVAPQPAL